jgi:hypothetical protein
MLNHHTHLIFSIAYPTTTSIPNWLQIRRETIGTLVIPAHACCLDRLLDSKNLRDISADAQAWNNGHLNYSSHGRLRCKDFFN